MPDEFVPWLEVHYNGLAQPSFPGAEICRGLPVEITVLDAIPFEPDVERLLRTLHLDAQGEHTVRVQELLGEARALARPKAIFRQAYIEARGDDFVVVDGVRLTSRVLSVNLAHAYRAFPWLATCGQELEAWSRTLSDMLDRYWAGAIMEAAMRAAVGALETELEARYALGRTATMNPGSLADWPLPEQVQLFALLGNPRQAIGVELSDSFLMTPVKSVSGLRFATETSFENCQLCPRPRCPGRRAPYDKDLYDKRYR